MVMVEAYMATPNGWAARAGVRLRLGGDARSVTHHSMSDGGRAVRCAAADAIDLLGGLSCSTSGGVHCPIALYCLSTRHGPNSDVGAAWPGAATGPRQVDASVLSRALFGKSSFPDTPRHCRRLGALMVINHNLEG